MTAASPTKTPSAASRLLVDVGPLLIFFLANYFAPVPGPLKIFVATGAFIVLLVAAIWQQGARCDRAERELERLRALHEPQLGRRNRSP